MLFLLPNKRGVEIPSTIMKHLARMIDPKAVVLFGDQANAENARKAIERLDPPYVFTTGHGIPCATTLQDNQPFVSLAIPEMNRRVCDAERNLDIWKGRVLHLHSCWCGKLLAPVLVERYGAWAVFAHTDEFLFLLPEDGKTIDLVVAAPFLAEFTVDVAMLSGKTAGEAQEERMAAYDKWIEYFYHGEGSKLKGASIVLRILIADKEISKLYGDKTATVVERRSIPKARLSLPLEVEGGEKVSPILLAIPLVLMMFKG
ncbi:MAG: hypothetical protein J7K48_08070 [Thermococcus sp.]|nr:hypothetical protein [Thermococcus sp.]